WTAAEVRVLAVFAVTAVAWTLRIAPHGGWTGWVGAPGASDATIALAAVLLMFLVPDGGGGKLLDWKTATDIPWGLLLLFGGGLALGEAFKSSGLAASMGDGLQQLASWPALPLMLAICLAVGFASEIASNTALANLLMPVMAAAAVAADLAPARLMTTTALAASLGFMLPIATAPNAIVTGTGMVDTRTMARLGFVLDVFGATAIALAVTLW
ncbi:MAG TPA: SLC13 family permease, partial [Kofleriaceae bacterium]|nr:SLC13 family permease [Kofleriaceae bacterium]